MNTQEVMHAYNKFERVGMNIPGYKKVLSPEIVKFVSEEAFGSFISYFELEPGRVDAAIKHELEYFANLSRSFEWKTYDTDKPSNIGEDFLVNGFTKGEPDSFMVLDLDTVHNDFEEYSFIVEVRDIKGIEDAIVVQEQVWGGDFSGQRAHLVNSKQSAPEEISIYVVYEDGKPVSSAWVVYSGDSLFAGIWGGSTISEYRGKGYYSALLHKRINDAKMRGKKYLIIDASDMSKPIVEKHGFKLIAKTIPYTYEHG